mmetsp:Transcript_18146/g.43238  ORF Transcript_18146/g.43238 Transcript_18146/m.43238 type:complete len:136 (+) Transcript_18146:124-531(+)
MKFSLLSLILLVSMAAVYGQLEESKGEATEGPRRECELDAERMGYLECTADRDTALSLPEDAEEACIATRKYINCFPPSCCNFSPYQEAAEEAIERFQEVHVSHDCYLACGTAFNLQAPLFLFLAAVTASFYNAV